MQLAPQERPSPANDRSAGFWTLAQRIALVGTRGAGRMAFLREVSDHLFEFSAARAITWWLTDVERDYRWRVSRSPESAPEFSPIDRPPGGAHDHPAAAPLGRRIAGLIERLGAGGGWSSAARRSYLAADGQTRQRLAEAAGGDADFDVLVAPSARNTLLLPLREESACVGLLALADADLAPLDSRDLLSYEQLADTIWRAVINRRAQFRLRERIKELTCLHGIARVSQRPDLDLDGRLQAIVTLMPAAMQFPEITAASLQLDDRRYQTAPAADAVDRLAAPITIGDRRRGQLEVAYQQPHSEFATGTFLPEERDLLDSAAHEISMLVERAEAAAAQASLAEGLRRRDRLASIGQLAAGVAHELNEPLGNILGFAELLQKHAGLPEPARRDAEQIVNAVLHGREIVKKLLQFARQGGGERVRLDLGRLVRDSLYFLEARCRRHGVELRLELADQPAFVDGSASELTQVLVNLGVNAIQAMPKGGVLTIGTCIDAHAIALRVSDNGVGMDEATQERLFTPFFTTKDIGEGTGLGLSVVMGIVSSHGGTIRLESAPGLGSTFIIHLPAAGEAPP